MTREQIEALGNQLVSIAGIFNPGSAVAIGLLLKAGTELNSMIQAIRQQTEANAPQVWAAVSSEYAEALAGFEQSRPSALNGP